LEQVLVRLGRRTAPSAVLLGGYAGTWARWADVARLPVDEPAVRRAGLTLGAGVVVPLADEACGVRVTADLLAYLASMSARQCGPCLYGLPAIAQHWAALADGDADRRTVNRLRGDVSAVEGRGACRHPDGATRLSTSALEVFGAHLAAHQSGLRCRYRGRMTLPGATR
ncbi:MAG TPA: NADH-ubiquinone oxidoreductase-F iron-sulfur binding region domain-containing protein, partial [Propionibacteriaceae bacterium]|nr:NADH-ubiquinone oxidoreductase-F iron-sulfur binding region domain-containing protein [Propionibacteriaceae bacterium]